MVAHLASPAITPQHAAALIIALIFFLGCIVAGCLWAVLILHRRRGLRPLPRAPYRAPALKPGETALYDAVGAVVWHSVKGESAECIYEGAVLATDEAAARARFLADHPLLIAGSVKAVRR